MGAKFFGKYRGRVLENIDPLAFGRLLVVVPGVTGTASFWAIPCAPYIGPGAGALAVPPRDSNVWV